MSKYQLLLPEPEMRRVFIQELLHQLKERITQENGTRSVPRLRFPSVPHFPQTMTCELSADSRLRGPVRVPTSLLVQHDILRLIAYSPTQDRKVPLFPVQPHGRFPVPLFPVQPHSLSPDPRLEGPPVSSSTLLLVHPLDRIPLPSTQHDVPRSSSLLVRHNASPSH